MNCVPETPGKKTFKEHVVFRVVSCGGQIAFFNAMQWYLPPCLCARDAIPET